MKSQGMFTTIKGEKFYKISETQTLSPFLITIASSSDIWMFLSSQGGWTAGRKTADNNIFPYETDDSLHMSYDAGSRIYIRHDEQIWQPFEQNVKFKISQNIYKSYYGTSVIVEEINHDWNISYSYHIQNSEKYGIIKTSSIKNLTDKAFDIDVLDGMLSIMPFGVNSFVQALSSNLVDSYKAAELVDDNLGVFSLTSQINNSPVPVEILKANIAYTTLADPKVYLNTDIIRAFKNADLIGVEQESYGKNCAYFVNYTETLEPSSTKEYSFIMDIDVDIVGITHIKNFIKENDFVPIFDDVKKCTEEVIKIVRMADGIQNTSDEIASSHHYLNTLYNVMRGGTFESAYGFDFFDFAKFVEKRNRVGMRNVVLVKDCKTIHQLKEVTKQDPILHRLALEYLPLTFSRRHGDPSRPWNDFNITIKNEKGEKLTHYEGYWRDIFQNWEALGMTYPAFYENMVAKFVNASTFDGFNPYQVSNEGIEWEKPDENNPLSNFGYWGDHQIIYLLRLLMGLNAHYPNRLQEMLTLDAFSYANVPYILESYNKIKENSKDTILFDFERDQKLEKQSLRMGTDGRLLIAHNKVYTVTLAEKLLVPLMSKVCNLLVGSGIWMNTQRPEWNDANNALVGTGLSMVTVYHIKAYVDFLIDIFAKAPSNSTYDISENVLKWFLESFALLNQHVNKYEGAERDILDGLGHIFSAYRLNSYKVGFEKKSKLDVTSILNYLKTVNSAIVYTINKNGDNEGVYATYNLLNYNFTSSPMQPMLEGQAAVISSGMLGTKEIEDLLENMKTSLFNDKVKAHMLYPVKKTKRFIDKNMVHGINTVVEGVTVKDENGNFHFDSSITTMEVLTKAIKRAKVDDLTMLRLIDAFDDTFAHKKFTGRSQVSYKYEGIGCIYWHQNAKLALAILETAVKLRNNGEDATRLREIYKEIMSGFIYRKTPDECHGIPIEPYSHSSYIGKSEQPGMTGQVKELILIRRLELGVQIHDGQIHFDGWFVDESEFDENNQLTFSIYSVPVIYKKDGVEKPYLNIELASGDIMPVHETFIDKGLSKTIFDRNNAVSKIEFVF